MTRLAGCLCLLVAGMVHAGEVGKLALTVKETAGIRRFDYPVHAHIELPRALTREDRFRLLANDKPVAAQFRVAGSRAVALDFNLSTGPFEKKTWILEYGPKVAPGPEPKVGLHLEENKDAFTIRSSAMAYIVPRNLKGLLQEVRDGKKLYTRPDSGGLAFKTADGKTHAVGGADVKARIVRQGPLAIVLRFDQADEVGRSVVELTFPRAKSWVEVRWLLTPARGVSVKELSVAMNLLVTETPTLVDFGAGSAVYTTLRKGEAALLRAQPPLPRSREHSPWQVLTARGNALQPFVEHHPARPTMPEGWAHVMDRQRCTALAMDAFARQHREEVRIEADGRLRLKREIVAAPIGPYRFWLHFVGMPVQVSAVTSPQSMQAPLLVEVAPRR